MWDGWMGCAPCGRGRGVILTETDARGAFGEVRQQLEVVGCESCVFTGLLPLQRCGVTAIVGKEPWNEMMATAWMGRKRPASPAVSPVLDCTGFLSADVPPMTTNHHNSRK